MTTVDKETKYENGERITEQTVTSTPADDCAVLAKCYELLSQLYVMNSRNPNNETLYQIQSTQDKINTYTAYLNGYERKEDGE